MVEVTVDASALVKWGRVLGEIPRVTKAASSRALNTYGDGVLQNMVRAIASANNWDPEAVRQRVIIMRATPNSLEYDMDFSQVIAGDQSWQRPWAERDQSNFDQDTLVKIITQDDGYDCQLCKDAAANSPYTMAQILDLQSKWADYVPPTPNIHPGVITNLIHPRCRCLTQPWSSTRRLPVTIFQGDSNVSVGMHEQLTARQLARMLNDEIEIEIRALRTRT